MSLTLSLSTISCKLLFHAILLLHSEPEAAMETNTSHSLYPDSADLPALIPIPVEHLQIPPTVSFTPSPSSVPQATRPNQMDLDGPVRPARHLKAPIMITEMPGRCNLSPVMTSELLKNWFWV